MPAMSNGVGEHQTPQEKLQAHLADPKTVDSLNRLLDRLDVVAASVEMMDGFIRRGPELADNFAAGVEEMRHKGDDTAAIMGKLPALARAGAKVADVADSPSFDRLLSSGLLDRLAEPRTIEGLTILLDKLDILVFSVQALDGFVRRGDAVTDAIAESMADLRNAKAPEMASVVQHLPQLASASVQFAEVAQTPEFGNLLGLMKDLGKPETVAQIKQLTGQLGLVVFAIKAVQEFVARGDEVADSLGESFGELRKIAASVDTAQLTRFAADLPKLADAGQKLVASGLLDNVGQIADAANKLAASGLLDKISELADAGMLLSKTGFFDPTTVKPLADFGLRAIDSYVAAKNIPAQKEYGLFDLLRLLKDPNIQRSLHLGVEMVKAYGRKLG